MQSMKVQTMAQNVTDNLIYWEWYMALKDTKKEINMALTLTEKKVKGVNYGTGKERKE